MTVPIDDPRAAERRFYIVSCLAAFAVVITGFGHTAYLRRIRGQPGLPALVAVHATLMAGWYVLFLVQAALIRARRTELHRRLGWFVSGWAALMVVVGVKTVLFRAESDPVTTGMNPASTYWLLFPLVAFAILVGSAVLLRRRRDYHKRLMLLSCIGLSFAGAGRLPLDGLPALAFLQGGGVGGLFALDLLMAYACVAWDTWRNRRLHPAFVFGTLAIVMQDTVLLKTAGWIRLATRLLT